MLIEIHKSGRGTYTYTYVYPSGMEGVRPKFRSVIPKPKTENQKKNNNKKTKQSKNQNNKNPCATFYRN